MLGFGHVLGYFAGTLDMSKFFGTIIGDTQFKQVCVIASATIVFCVGLTCFCVEERVLLSERYAPLFYRNNICLQELSVDAEKSGAWGLFATILKTTLHMPRKIRAVCWITFWSWIGGASVAPPLSDSGLIMYQYARVVSILWSVTDD